MTDVQGRDAATELADSLLTMIFDADPLAASALGVPGHDHRLPDASQGAEAQLRAALVEIGDRAGDASPASPASRVTLAAVRDTAHRMVLEIDNHAPDHTVSAMPFAAVPGLFAVTAVTTLPDDRARADYLSRVAQAGDYIDQVAERLRAGRAAGRLPVAPLVEQTIAWADAQLAAGVPDALSAPADAALRPELDATVHEHVVPALQRYRDLLVELLPDARPEDRAGLLFVPGGEEDYARAIQVHTTLDVTAGELHQAGLDEIDRLTARALEIGSRLGLDGLPAIRAAIASAAAGIEPEVALAAAQAAVERAEAASHGLLPPPDNAPCAVTAMPPSVADSGMAPHYTPPGAGGRPGTYWFNTRGATIGTGWDLEGVAFHEAVPGHHLHLARLQQLPGISALQARLPITVHAEGWGLYSEQLADELGLYSDDRQLLGSTFLQMHRAARLVVDTGLHAFGWSRSRAADFLVEHVALGEGFLRAETDRYIAMPGQALAYQTGKTEILRLRAEAQARLGERFELAGFHSALLDHGMASMPALAGIIDDWIDATVGPSR